MHKKVQMVIYINVCVCLCKRCNLCVWVHPSAAAVCTAAQGACVYVVCRFWRAETWWIRPLLVVEKKNCYVWIRGRFKFRYDGCKQNELQNLLNSGQSVVWVVTRPASVNYGWMDKNLKHVSLQYISDEFCVLSLCNTNFTAYFTAFSFCMATTTPSPIRLNIKNFFG